MGRGVCIFCLEGFQYYLASEETGQEDAAETFAGFMKQTDVCKAALALLGSGYAEE